jgi:hypothetical protein
MANTDPHLSLFPPEVEGTLYRDVVDVAFEVLRGDLVRERKKLKQKRSRREASRLPAAVPLSKTLEPARKLLDTQARVKKLLTGLARLEEMYRKRYAAGAGQHYLPSARRTWTLADKQQVLNHLARIIHDRDLVASVYQDEHLMRELWENGYFATVERLCDETEEHPAAPHAEELAYRAEEQAYRAEEASRVEEQQARADGLAYRAEELPSRADELLSGAQEQQARADELVSRVEDERAWAGELVVRAEEQQARSEELEWLRATWIPRRASVVASLPTSQRLTPSRRPRRPAAQEPVPPPSLRRSRSTTRRTPGEAGRPH